jgi:hypothetical protein
VVVSALHRREGQTEPPPFGVYGAVTAPGRVRAARVPNNG